MTHALAVPHADSRTAACSRGSFDGSDRDYFFPRIVIGVATRPCNQSLQLTAGRCDDLLVDLRLRGLNLDNDLSPMKTGK
jgi:hypothetical protein